MKCQRTEYENTSHKQEQNIGTKRQKNLTRTIIQITQRDQKGFARRNMLEGKHTYSRTDSCCTDEATRRRGTHQHKDGGQEKGNKERYQEKNKEKNEKIVPQAVIVSWVPVSYEKPDPGT